MLHISEEAQEITGKRMSYNGAHGEETIRRLVDALLLERS
jgi:hypothetical protein